MVPRIKIKMQKTLGGVVETFPRLYDVENFDLSTIVRARASNISQSEFLGQDDYNGNLNLSSIAISEAGKQALASVGYAQIPYIRCTTNTGQYAIGEYKNYNPDFKYLLYFRFGHVAVVDPGQARAWESEEQRLLIPYAAKDLNGDPMVAWPLTGPAEAYWVNYYTPKTPGYNFNKNLIDAQLALLKSEYDRIEHKPDGIVFDYFNRKDSGYWRIATQNDELDMDQNGIAYSSDADEQNAFLEFQEYYIDRTRELLGDNVYLIANGKAVHPGQESTILSRLNGWYIENFPVNPWFSPNDCFKKMWDMKQDPSSYLEFRTRQSETGLPVIYMEPSQIYPSDSVNVESNRVAALLFDCVWVRRPADTGGSLDEGNILDETFSGYVSALGDPIDGVQLTGIAGVGLHTYHRLFENGVIHVLVDADLSGINQIVSTGVAIT